MKKTLLTILIVLAGTNAWAQKGLLWEISGNGLKSPSYLYGTIHAICPNDYIMPDGMEQALANSRAICLELDVASAETATKMMQAMVDPQMRNFTGELNPEAVAGIDSLMKLHMQLGLEQLGILKPWVVSSTLSIKTLIDCPDMKQLETEFAMYAKQENKDILQLETVELQIALFDNMDRNDQIKGINDIVMDSENARTKFAQLIEAYRNQDLTHLMEITVEDPTMKKYQAAMLDNRNAAWIPIMKEMMTTRSVFFAVGAGHLGGTKGVIALLQEAGFTLNRVAP